MSANNWRDCPQCEIFAFKRKEQLVGKAAEAYGKVPPEEYQKLVKEASESRPPQIGSLREDYELWIAEGRLEITYCASCEECGFEHKFTHAEPLNLKQEPTDG